MATKIVEIPEIGAVTLYKRRGNRSLRLSVAADGEIRVSLPSWVLEVYAANPVTIGVLGFHRAFWDAGTVADYPPNLGLRMLIAGIVGVLLLWFSHRMFTRLQGNFAQEL